MEEQIDRFLVQLKGDRGFSFNTVSAYRNDLNQFTKFMRNERGINSWAELSESQLTSYVLHLRERQYARSTVARKVAAVKSFCSFLVDSNVLRSAPTENLASPKVDKFSPRAMSHSDIEQLLKAPCGQKSPEALRDKAMLETLYATGMRVSELTALDTGDVDLQNGMVTCGRRPDRLRQAPLGENARSAVLEYLNSGRPLLANARDADALFLNHRGARLTRQGFWLILKAYADSVGIGNITPHTIRHSFAVHQLSQGTDIKDIQRIMGHMSIATTQAYQQLVVAPQNDGNNLVASDGHLEDELLEPTYSSRQRTPSTE